MICTACGSVYFASPPSSQQVLATDPNCCPSYIYLSDNFAVSRFAGSRVRRGMSVCFLSTPPPQGVRYSPFWRTDYDGDRHRFVPLFDLTKNRPRPLKKKIPNNISNNDGMEGLLVFFFHLRVSILYLYSTYLIVIVNLGSRSYTPFHLPCFFRKKTLSPTPTHTICDCTHAV